MQAYLAYYEKGHIIPVGSPVIPEGSQIIITVLDKPVEDPIQRRLRAIERFRQEIRDSNEPLGPEFDEIISQRVNIEREVDL